MLTLTSLDQLKDHTGQEIGVSGWFAVTQERIQKFADATLDHQWIHIDQERAKRESPFNTTISHGFLTLSLLPQFVPQVLKIDGVRMGINYGLNRLRFVSPVKSGSKIRARFTLQSVKDVAPAGVEAVYLVAIEGESGDKPCCVAEWVVRYYR